MLTWRSVCDGGVTDVSFLGLDQVQQDQQKQQLHGSEVRQ